LEPASEAGLTAAIRARQALGQEAEVEALRTRLRQERDAGKNPRLKAMLSYERQFEILPDGSRFSALEAFDEQTGYVWSYFLIKPDHKIYRRLEMAPAHAGDARVKFMLGEMLGEAQKITGYKIHRLYPDKPSFTRAWQDARREVYAAVGCLDAVPPSVYRDALEGVAMYVVNRAGAGGETDENSPAPLHSV